jgi:hypothetical protein
MISSVLLLSAVLAGVLAGDDALPGPSDLGEYKSAAALAHRDPEAHVRLALWCEVHGLTAERLKDLSLAVLYAPSHALARGLLGRVAYRGRWERPDQVSLQVQEDPEHKARTQEYLQGRVQLRERADDNWKLAMWCEQNGLKEQATAHLHQVLRLDAKCENAWKRLGYKRMGGHWVKPVEAAAAKAEVEQQKANNHWKPILERLRNGIQLKDASRRAETEKSLAQIRDLYARSEGTICLGKFPTFFSAFLPDGSLVALGDLDCTVRVWDLSGVINRRLGQAAPDP